MNAISSVAVSVFFVFFKKYCSIRCLSVWIVASNLCGSNLPSVTCSLRSHKSGSCDVRFEQPASTNTRGRKPDESCSCFLDESWPEWIEL